MWCWGGILQIDVRLYVAEEGLVMGGLVWTVRCLWATGRLPRCSECRHMVLVPPVGYSGYGREY